MNPYEITIYEKQRPARTITTRLGDSPPTPTMGGGGWQTVTLPKRSAVTVWQGRDQLLTLTIPIVLGGYIDGEAPVFPEQNALTGMWRTSDPTRQPPIVNIRALGDAVPFQHLDYVMTDLAWGSAAGDAFGNAQAERVWQKMVVTLVEYRADERLQTHKIKRRHREPPDVLHGDDPNNAYFDPLAVYVVKKGDTLISIARRLHLKNWQQLGNAQHPQIHDPRKIKVGQRLKIP